MNKSECMILSLLSKKAMSGYDIKQMANYIYPLQWAESNAQIYPILKKLEKEKMVQSSLDEKSGDRNRRLYSLTSIGLDYLKTWLRYPVQPSLYREELLLKLSAAEHLPIAVLARQIENYHGHLSEQYHELATIQQQIEQEDKEGLKKLYLMMIYDYMKVAVEAKSNWCQKALEKLKVATDNLVPDLS